MPLTPAMMSAKSDTVHTATTGPDIGAAQTLAQHVGVLRPDGDDQGEAGKQSVE